MNLLNPLAEFGLLGMNRRNADYILSLNPRKFYPLVDDKLKTKELLQANGLPSPELYFTIEGNYDLRILRELKFLREFAVKPARGAEGRGIMILVDRQEKVWKKASGEAVRMEDLQYHISNILAGLFSLGGSDDRAFIEYRVRTDNHFEKISFQGVPDIRVILFKGVPLMSMLRLPTRESDGRANLHQGAVGTGVDMAEGLTLGGVHKGKLVDIHPDTQSPIAGVKIPHWEKILEISAKVYDVFRLGYIGVDFVIDSRLGPMILELNARPGLSIQLANREGLLKRISFLENSVIPSGWEGRLELTRKMLVR